MARKSPLEDPRAAAFAWKRWRRMMALMAGATALTIGAVFAWLARSGEPLSIHFYVATRSASAP